MLPTLRALRDGGEAKLSELPERVAEAENLAPEDVSEMYPSGSTSILKDRVSWGLTYMRNAGLVERPRRGVYRITPQGEELLAKEPARIDMSLLREYPSFSKWKGKATPTNEEPPNGDKETPEELLGRAMEQVNSMLEQEILQRLRNAEPTLLEHTVVKLLIAMGYGGGDATMGQVTGRSGDGGIDGTIREDALGLDEVYLQAKRYAAGNSVGEDALRNFAGAIDAAGTTKGVFVTTSHFTAAAVKYVRRSPKRIVLINGEKLARLMVKHDIGVRTRSQYVVKRIDEDHFDLSA